MKHAKMIGVAALSMLVAFGITSMVGSRNTGGTYSYPGGTYPVISGTNITSAWANSVFGDISSTLTNSLDRNGYGAMLAPLRVPDGTVTAPTLAFSNETGSGVYRIGAADVALSVNGTKRQEWTSTGTTVTGTLAATGAISGASVAATSGTVNTVRPATGNSLDLRALGDVSPGVILGTSGTLAAGNALSIQNNATVLCTLAYNGDWDMGGHLIKNLYGSPSASTDVATKGYVDGKFPAVSWTAPTLTANWTNGTGNDTVGYFKDAAGVVHLKGTPTAAAGAGVAMFNLPAGYRPKCDAPNGKLAAYVTVTGQSPQPVTVTSGGDVRVSAYTGSLYDLGSVSFVAEQ